jgi:hypothetical protein
MAEKKKTRGMSKPTLPEEQRMQFQGQHRDLRFIAKQLNTPAEGAPAAVWCPIDLLVPWADNPRFNDPEHVDQVAASIEAFGWGPPCVANARDGAFVAGHTRVLAGKKLGMPLIPVRFMDLTPAQAEKLAVTDNRLTELGKWNDPKLAGIVANWTREDAHLVGFDDEAIDRLAAVLGDEIPPLPDDWDNPSKLPNPDLVFFRFGAYSGHVAKKLYDAFATKMVATKEGGGAVMLDDVLKKWLGLRDG